MGFETDKNKIDKAYRDGDPLISDYEYDETFGVNASDMESVSEFKSKVKHGVFMGSLNKVSLFDEHGQYARREFRKWWTGFEPSPITVASWKYDGLSCELIYKNGRFKKAISRGDGVYGEDITDQVMQMENFKIVISEYFTGSLKAEIVMRKSSFSRYLEETTDKILYANERNGAAGAVRANRNCEYLSLMYWGVDEGDRYMMDIYAFTTLEDLGFTGVEYVEFSSLKEFDNVYEKMLDIRQTLDFLVDGLVVSIDDSDLKEHVGFDSRKRPKFRIAVKFPSPSAETTIKDIEWAMGKNGTITPVGIVEPVDLGVTVERVSLANIDKMKEKRIMIGDRIILRRAGDVIPFCEKNLTEHENYKVLYPEKCPTCETLTKVKGAFLICPNLNCPARAIGNIEKWMNKMKEHFRITNTIGRERIRELYHNKTISDVADMYELTVVQLVEDLSRCGIKLAENILKFQHYKVIPLDIFMSALNVGGIGKSIWKMMIDNSPYNTIEKIIEISEWRDIYQRKIEGLGEVRCIEMFEGIKANKELIKKLLSVGITPIHEKETVKRTGITGFNFVITGTFSMNRIEMIEFIQKNGGEVKSSVSKKVDYLVAGDNTGKTKLTKAKSLNVEIITEKQLIDRV